MAKTDMTLEIGVDDKSYREALRKMLRLQRLANEPEYWSLRLTWFACGVATASAAHILWLSIRIGG